MSILHEDAFVIEDADIEVGFLLNELVKQTIQLSGGYDLTMRTLPQVEMAACAVRLGGFENGYEMYGNIGHWVEENGYQFAGPVRELFIKQAPLDRIEGMVCEIQIPVALSQPRSLSLTPH